MNSAGRPCVPLPLPVSAGTRVPVWVWAGLLLLHLLALGWQLHHRQPLFPDSERYLQAARNLRDADLLYALPLAEKPLIPQEYTIRPPLYPLFLLLTGGAGAGFPLATLLLQNLLSLLNMGLALRWLNHRTRGLSNRQWAVVLALASAAPGQFIYANVLMSEILLQTAVVGLWLSLEALFARAGQRPRLTANKRMAADSGRTSGTVGWPVPGVTAWLLLAAAGAGLKARRLR